MQLQAISFVSHRRHGEPSFQSLCGMGNVVLGNPKPRGGIHYMAQPNGVKLDLSIGKGYAPFCEKKRASLLACCLGRRRVACARALELPVSPTFTNGPTRLGRDRPRADAVGWPTWWGRGVQCTIAKGVTHHVWRWPKRRAPPRSSQ